MRSERLENGSTFFGSQVDTMVDNLWKCLSNYGQAIETRGDGRAAKLLALLLFTDFQPGLSGRCNNWAEGSHQNLGSWIKMGFVPDGGFPVPLWTRVLFADHTNSQYVLCGEFWDPEEGWTRRNPKCLTRKAQRCVFTASVSGIPKSHFSNESPEPWRMLGVGLGQSCPGILQS